MIRPAGRLVVPFLMLQLLGCVGWYRADQPQPVLERVRARPQAMRVQLPDSSIVTFRKPAVQGDSIYETDRMYGSGRTVAVADVVAVETQHLREGRIFLSSAGVLVAVLVVALVSLTAGLAF